jgi:hypothetical protein
VRLLPGLVDVLTHMGTLTPVPTAHPFGV